MGGRQAGIVGRAREAGRGATLGPRARDATALVASKFLARSSRGKERAEGGLPGAGLRLPSSRKGRERREDPLKCLAGLGPEDLPSSIDSIVEGTGNAPQVLEAAPKPPSDIEYLQELIAIQQNGPKNIGFFGTRNMGFLHQQLIEILSYAMVLTVRKRPFARARALRELAPNPTLTLLSPSPPSRADRTTTSSRPVRRERTPRSSAAPSEPRGRTSSQWSCPNPWASSPQSPRSS